MYHKYTTICFTKHINQFQMNICRTETRFFSTAKVKLAKVKTPRVLQSDFKKKINTAVYGCGLSASGALSVPKLVVSNQVVTSKEVAVPIRIRQLNTWDIKHVAAGFGFSLFASNNKLYGAGINNRYQLTTKKVQEKSLTDYYISCKQLRLPNDPKILSISCGRAHSLIATTSGVYAFGENCHGQCGQNPENKREVFGQDNCELSPVEIPSDSPVKLVHCLLDTSFVLTEAGEVFAFGLNEDGQCANGITGIQWRPEKITGDAANVNIDAISGTSDTPVAVSKNGELFLWGQCEYGQAIMPSIEIFAKHSVHVPFAKKIASAASASSAVLVCTEDGEVFVWGVGLLGMGPELQRQSKPLFMDQPLFDSEKVIKVVAGITSFGAITEKGRAYTWGQNRFSLLGLGHTKDQYFPYQMCLPSEAKSMDIGPDHTLILTK